MSSARQSEKLLIAAAVIAVVVAIAAGSVAYATNFFTLDKGADRAAQVEPSEGALPAAATNAATKNVQTRFIALEERGDDGSFALWSRGRFASTSMDGKNLIFEVNPQMEHVGVWGSLGIDGSMTVLGSSEVGNLAASGDVNVGRSATVRGFLQAGDVAADAVTAQLLTGDSAVLQALKTTLAECGEATVEKLTAGDINARAAKATTLETQALTADAATVSKLDATNLEAGAVEAEDIVSQTLDAQTVNSVSLVADTLDVTTIGADSVTTDKILAGTVTTDKVITDDLSTGAATVDTLTAGSLIANALAGVLQTVEVASQGCGTVLFDAIGAAGEGYVPAYAITVPAGTTAVFLQAERGDGDWVCAWEVEQVSSTEWSIIRRFPKLALDEMGGGVFTPTGEVLVHWLAVGAR